MRNNAADVETLLAQIAAVNERRPVHLVPFGGKARKSLCAHEKRLADSGLVAWITKIPLYSGSNGRIHEGNIDVYRALVHQALKI